MLRYLLPLLLLAICACQPATPRQEIDLTDRVVTTPEDGIGHYVYALSLPERVAPGGTLDVQMDWRTVGPADGRRRYAMEVLLDGPARKDYTIRENENTVGEINLINWFNHDFAVPANFPAGEYTVAVRLLDATNNNETVPLGFEPELALGDGFYRIATVAVAAEE